MCPSCVFHNSDTQGILCKLEILDLQSHFLFFTCYSQLVVDSKLPEKHASCLSFVPCSHDSIKHVSFLRGTNCLQLLAKAHLTECLGLTPSSNPNILHSTHRKPHAQKFSHGRVQCVLNVSYHNLDYRVLLCVMLEIATSRQKAIFSTCES